MSLPKKHEKSHRYVDEYKVRQCGLNAYDAKNQKTSEFRVTCMLCSGKLEENLFWKVDS